MMGASRVMTVQATWSCCCPEASSGRSRGSRARVAVSHFAVQTSRSAPQANGLDLTCLAGVRLA